MKIGIMGGTFDPIHNGHIMLAECAYEQFHLDRIWFLPNGRPPHKAAASIESDVKSRTKMVALAIEEDERFALEQYEVSRAKTSYSYETLEHFHRQYPEEEFYFIIGADSLFAIESWVHPERIFPVCTILAAYRDDKDKKQIMLEEMLYLQDKYHANIKLLETPVLPVSSTELRDSIKNGASIHGLVPERVEDYIIANGLYKDR